MDPHDIEATPMEVAIAAAISSRCCRLVVLHAVDLNDKSLRKAHEVDDVRPNGCLTTKVMACAPQELQLVPQPLLCDRWSFAEASCPAVGHSPGSSPHPYPLPIKGEGDDKPRRPRLASRYVRAGLNMGSEMASVCFSKVTSRSMSSFKASGVCGQPTMLVIMRGPSASSTTAMA